MYFDKSVFPYLSGNKFSNGLAVKLSPSKDINIKRIDLLETLITGKNVLHIGCADHLPLIEEKIKQDNWLHQRFTLKSKFCIGIDNNIDAVNFIKDKLQIPNIYHLDIINDEISEDIIKIRWDYVVLGEILEHVDNPVTFLSSLNKKLRINSDHLLITVPNAFELSNFLYSFRNTELINSDHRYWFTPYTLSKIAILSGFTIEEIYFSQTYPHNKFWKNYIINRFPFFRESIVVKLNFIK